jgi:hypothetical protein
MNHLHRWLLLLALPLWATGVAAAGDVTAEDLVEYCGITEEDPESHTAIAFCYGYIDAALDYHHAITADGKGRITCPPGTVSRGEVAVAFVEWAEVNTDKVDDQPPVHVVIRAMGEKWPCE